MVETLGSERKKMDNLIWRDKRGLFFLPRNFPDISARVYVPLRNFYFCALFKNLNKA
jgi:hypothetical protein